MAIQRKADTHIVVPFVHGSISWWMGNNGTQSNMYDWKVYLRGVNGEDLSTIIKSVTFTLHASFRQNQRVIDHFPFEVREQGWGEFEVEEKVEFKNDAELPVTFTHFLKLHPYNGEQNKENVFLNPTLMTPFPKPELPPESIYWTAFNESDSLAIIMRAQNYITEELNRTRDMLAFYEMKTLQLQQASQRQQAAQQRHPPG